MEIRRSVMGRPNLSVRGTIIGRSFRKRDASGKNPADASFPMRSLRSAGGDGVPTSTLGKCGASTLARVLPSPPRPEYARRPRRSETHSHYRACRGREGFKVSRFQGFKVSESRGFKVSRFRNPEGVVDRRLGQWYHDLVS